MTLVKECCDLVLLVSNDHGKAPFPGGVCHHVEYSGIAVFCQKKNLLHLEDFTKGQKDFPSQSPEVKTYHETPQNYSQQEANQIPLSIILEQQEMSAVSGDLV